MRPGVTMRMLVASSLALSLLASAPSHAAELKLTLAPASAPGFVTIYPAATSQPLASNLNVDDAGQTIPNLVVSRLGYLGRVSMFSLTDIDLVFDVAGWFTGDLTPTDPNVPLDPDRPEFLRPSP